RSKAIREMEREARHKSVTQIFIETPYRNNRLLEDLLRQLAPDTLLCVASDITGPRQSIETLPVKDWRSRPCDYSKIPSIFLICS
ncbi:MAG: SAM-dependent methyltransferase, partial [Muribaculaceae bacterium]|nr:SAM-dependent methyltransferase [Muribaculaceae bacterium]